MLYLFITQQFLLNPLRDTDSTHQNKVKVKARRKFAYLDMHPSNCNCLGNSLVCSFAKAIDGYSITDLLQKGETRV